MRQEYYAQGALARVTEVKRVNAEIRYIETVGGSVRTDRLAIPAETDSLLREEKQEAFQAQLAQMKATIETNKAAKPYGEILYTLAKFLGLIDI